MRAVTESGLPDFRVPLTAEEVDNRVARGKRERPDLFQLYLDLKTAESIPAVLKQHGWGHVA